VKNFFGNKRELGKEGGNYQKSIKILDISEESINLEN
jgi:hypothetical protein